MLSLKFSEFRSSKYDDGDEFHQLYVLKDSQRVLYVGIGRNGTWNRWFGGWGSHLIRNIHGEYFPSSDAGRVVIENSPESDGWTIELWTREDCLHFLEGEINKHFVTDRLFIEDLEPMMIHKLQPSLNVIYNSW